MFIKKCGDLKKLIFIVLTLCCFFALHAQNDQVEYLEAKRLFKLGKYSSAKAAFGSLLNSPNFQKYAQFYYALSSYHQGDVSAAIESWESMLSRYPDWPQRNELYYWLSLSSFEQNEYVSGLKYAQKLGQIKGEEKTADKLIGAYVKGLELETLDSLNDVFPDNRDIAKQLVVKLGMVSYQERDFQRIEALVDKWNFDQLDLEFEELPRVMKDQYDIAVLLPFLFESLDNTQMISQNSLVMDMYQGMLLAAEDLKEAGKPINLVPFDTRRDAKVTKAILDRDALKQTDLIVGPLYPGPNEVVNSFSKENRINTTNPLSSNPEVIGDNPYSFLVRSTSETAAAALANFAATENTDNPYAMLFYAENKRDSGFAAVYKRVLEEKGYLVLGCVGINKENAKELAGKLTEQYDSYYTKAQADSIGDLPDRFIRTRRVRKSELKSINSGSSSMPVSYQDGEPIVYYEKTFYMAPDSIGHVMVASKSNLFANNIISAIETRGDSMNLYGYGDWLDFTMISYEQLERLNVALAHPEYIDYDDVFYKRFSDRIQEKYKTIPSINHMRGYDLIWFTGRMMHLSGKYFQRELRRGAFVSSRLFQGYKYGSANDNQIVPIVRFRGSELKVENKDSYED